MDENIVIQVEQLTKEFESPEGTLTILEDINFTINRAETLAVVGASGSGKSTLLGLLAGLDTPSRGRVILDGTDLNTLDEDGRARFRAHRVGFVFQSFHLLPSLTALENVMLPLELNRHKTPTSAARGELERVGLGQRLQHYPNQLSGGEQQRVAIARAFVSRPRILFADEPTGNLDRKTGAMIGELLFAIKAEYGTTMVLVTHDESLAGHCGRRLALEMGRLVEGQAA
jgi:putative ABC transport system ATP-binding protein